ncbi:MAG: hypothetical protein ACRD52_19610 [Candidatus Acidiferrales bacterium]
MPIDPSRTEITLHGDTRLVAAVGAVVTHASQRLGICEEADGLSASAMELVRGIFSEMGNRGKSPQSEVQVVVENHSGQLRVTVECPGEAVSPGRAPSVPAKIWDNAKCESRNGTCCVVLTKAAPEK